MAAQFLYLACQVEVRTLVPSTVTPTVVAVLYPFTVQKYTITGI